MRPMDGLAAATEPWYCPVATMKALHQARAASPPGLASLAAHSLARSPVRPLLKVCSEICADACPIMARVAPRTEPRTLAGTLDCDMPMTAPARETTTPLRWWPAASCLRARHDRARQPA